MKKYAIILRLAAAALFILSTTPIGYSQEENSPAPIFNASSKIAVIPFFQGKFDINSDEPQDQLLTCEIDQLCFIRDDIMMGADKKLTDFTQNVLAERLEDQLIPKGVVSAAITGIRPFGSKATPKSIAIEAGNSLGAGVVIVGSVWRYKNRVSAKGSTDQPTSAAFVVYLLDVSTGNTIWKNKFVKSQTALTENITNIKLVFKGGIKWLSADELAEYGVEEVFKEFPYPKK